MTWRRLSRLLIFAGAAGFVLATAWWYLYFEQMLGDSVKQASQCFYHNAPACEIAQAVDSLFDVPAYSPFALYIAVGVFAVGMVLRIVTSDVTDLP